jgi:radical SAM superfamily enzyme YgiQ (UPF0313 family)
LKILMVYPRYPDTFWSFRHALKFIAKKAPFPPLSLLTVAAMLPSWWEKRLVDMNTSRLRDRDLKWADYIFLSGMVVQRDSALEVIARARKLGKKIVAGGPLFTTEYDLIKGVDHFVLDEGEITLPLFLKDLAAGRPQPIYTSQEKPDLSRTPIPVWSLIKMDDYSSMCVQYSRGCPFNCEFCDIVALYGHNPRTKPTDQMIGELETLYQHGWRGGLFIVDDNFIGNKNKLKAELLPAIIAWQRERKHPFELSTEASINMADDEELMNLMAEAGFNQVFIGVETPNPEGLAECGKTQNKQRDLVAAIKQVQAHGMQVQGGFIVGFDSDPPSIFKNQIEFIQQSGIVTAMVGILMAPRGSRLYQRLKGENRLLSQGTGDNTDGSTNFVPKMKLETLTQGYRQIMNTIYAPKQYYERVKTFLKEYKPRRNAGVARLKMHHIDALLKSMWWLGVVDKGRKYYWKLFFTTAVRRPRAFPLAINLSVIGFHFRKTAEKYLHSPRQSGGIPS